LKKISSDIKKDAARPFQHVERLKACENSKFEVFFDHLIDGDSNAVENYLVVSLKRKTVNLVTGVAVLPVINGRIALLSIYRHPIDRWSWEIPRGFLEPGEEEELSIARELEEETGFVCEKNALHSLGFFTPDGGILSARIQLYVATECKVSRPYVPNELGHGEMRLFEMEEIISMANDSSIEDPSTLIAIYRYFAKRNSEF
jgi:ADP-ribose pyrophosphatase